MCKQALFVLQYIIQHSSHIEVMVTTSFNNQTADSWFKAIRMCLNIYPNRIVTVWVLSHSGSWETRHKTFLTLSLGKDGGGGWRRGLAGRLQKTESRNVEEVEMKKAIKHGRKCQIRPCLKVRKNRNAIVGRKRRHVLWMFRVANHEAYCHNGLQGTEVYRRKFNTYTKCLQVVSFEMWVGRKHFNTYVLHFCDVWVAQMNTMGFCSPAPFW